LPDAFNKHGGYDRVGVPTNNVHLWGNGVVQDFDGGQNGWGILMRRHNTTVFYYVSGKIWEAYRNTDNGAPGWLGYPTSDPFQEGGVTRQNFEGGHITFNGQTATVHRPTPPVQSEPDPGSGGNGKYYPDLASLTKANWNYQSKDNSFFDGKTGNGESLPSVKQVYSDLSNGIFGSYKAMTAGYFDTTNYSGTHYGIDMAGLAGNPVITVVGGTTTLVQNIAGNYFIGVKGDDGNLWIYGHLENYSVGIGKRIEAGTKIGTIFDGAYLNGYWMSPHLHLEVHQGHTYSQAKSISPLEAYWKLRNL
jgi:murein DD-endopeptidase MepM/ murein hydrolase activator NlpD